MECSCQSLINPIKELQQARSNVLLTWVPHEKTHGPMTIIMVARLRPVDIKSVILGFCVKACHVQPMPVAQEVASLLGKSQLCSGHVSACGFSRDSGRILSVVHHQPPDENLF